MMDKSTNNPVLVLEFGGIAKKRGEKSEEEDVKKEALSVAAGGVRKALKSDDDEKLALALWDFIQLCQSIGYDEEDMDEEENSYHEEE